MVNSSLHLILLCMMQIEKLLEIGFGKRFLKKRTVVVELRQVDLAIPTLAPQFNFLILQILSLHTLHYLNAIFFLLFSVANERSSISVPVQHTLPLTTDLWDRTEWTVNIICYNLVGTPRQNNPTG